ncbi:hypothetical protein DYB32_000775 [Aphanomyces invadans]|uniref:Uncharacterized protein n=1 Tax=Aphanomyces invadans TaxID=157072 RepID=A0A3R7AFH3_9STRA|nr:hypothetical protein DYB32_000775 [Aphanomyces invadans]
MWSRYFTFGFQVIQVSAIDRPQPVPVPSTLLPQSFLDDNPTPTELTDADIILDPASVPLPELPTSNQTTAAAMHFPSYVAPVDIEEMAKAPPKVSVHSHQKRLQGTNTIGAGGRDDPGGSAEMEEIDKKRAEMQLAPLSAGPNDVQFEVKFLKKFVNRSRVLKKYMHPNALTRELAGGDGRRDSLFNVMDNPTDIRMGGADGMTLSMPRTPPLGSMHHPNRPRNVLLGSDDDGDTAPGATIVHASHRHIISLEARHKDVQSLRHAPTADLDDEDDGARRRSTNLFQKFCHHIVQKQRTKYQVRVSVNIISEIDNADASDPVKKKAPVARRQHDRDAAKAFLSGVDAVLSLDELYDEAVVAEKARHWRRATMLASACISIEKDWIEPLLLRARLCRRLGLWFDLTSVSVRRHRSVLPSTAHDACRNWRAFYERAYLRHRMIEGMADGSATAPAGSKDKADSDATATVMSIPSLIGLTIDDYMNAIRTGCALHDVVETIGDLTIRLVEWTHDAKHCLHVVAGLTALIAVMDDADARVKDRRRLAKAASTHDSTVCEMEEDRLAKIIACLLTQRGRLYILVRRRISKVV